jgi:hypothetical protein
MAADEGIVTTVRENGLAQVIIQPGSAGVPGVSPEVNSRFCHCATEGSTIVIEVANRAGAGVGDWVALDREKGARGRNALALLGIPALGALSGLGVAFLLVSWFSSAMYIWTAFPAGGLVLGILLGRACYRRISARSLPFITRVVKTREEAAALAPGNGCAAGNRDGICDSCATPFLQRRG